MDEMIKDYNNYVSFIFYEYEKKCAITVYNKKEVLGKYNVSKEEGKRILLDYCFSQRSLELEPHIDTICLKNYSNKIRGFIRYMEEPEVIRNEIIDLFYNSVIPKFICDFLETLQKQSKKIEVDFKQDDHYPFEKGILDMANEQNLMTFKVDKKGYFPYIISNYMCRHENVKIQEAEAREDGNQIMLDAIQFSIELLNKEQKEYFYSQIRERSNESYVQHLESLFGQKLMQTLEEQDGMQRVRTNPNTTGEE